MNQLTVQQNVMKTMIPSCLSAVKMTQFWVSYYFRTGKNDIPLQTDQRGIEYSSYILLGCASENVLGISMPLLSVCKGI